MSIHSCQLPHFIFSFPLLHFSSFMSGPSCQFIHYNSCMSKQLFQLTHVHFFTSCTSIHSLQFLHFNSFLSIHSFNLSMSIHSFQFIRFNPANHSFMSFESFRFIHFKSLIPIRFCQVIHFNSFKLNHEFHSFVHSFIHSFISFHVVQFIQLISFI